MDGDPFGAEGLHQPGADAEEERVPRGQHHDRFPVEPAADEGDDRVDIAADGLLFRPTVLETGELAPAADEDIGRVDALALRRSQVPGVHPQADDIDPAVCVCRVQAWPSPPGPESNATRPSKSKITARISTAGPAKRPGGRAHAPPDLPQ